MTCEGSEGFFLALGRAAPTASKAPSVPRLTVQLPPSNCPVLIGDSGCRVRLSGVMRSPGLTSLATENATGIAFRQNVGEMRCPRYEKPPALRLALQRRVLDALAGLR